MSEIRRIPLREATIPNDGSVPTIRLVDIPFEQVTPDVRLYYKAKDENPDAGAGKFYGFDFYAARWVQGTAVAPGEKLHRLPTNLGAMTGYTILESAEDYAREWAGRNGWYITLRIPTAQPIYNYRGTGCDYPGICLCIGGLPMIKFECPRHGHLARRSATWESWGK